MAPPWHSELSSGTQAEASQGVGYPPSLCTPCAGVAPRTCQSTGEVGSQGTMGCEVGGPGPGRELSTATNCVLTVTQTVRRHGRWP